MDNTKVTVIPADITRIAHWPNLREMDLAKHGGYDLDSCMHLLDLYSCLNSGRRHILML